MCEQAESRPGSLIFDQSQLDAINNFEPTDFEQDIALPDDIDHGKKRRDSNELDAAAVPNGVRDTDDEDEDEDADHDRDHGQPEEKASEVVGVRMVPNHAMLHGNGYDVHDDDHSDREEDEVRDRLGQMMGDDEEHNDGVRSEQPFHDRMDTNQQIMVASAMSQQQLEFDHSLEEMRAERDELQSALEAVQGERDQLRQENEKLATQVWNERHSLSLSVDLDFRP